MEADWYIDPLGRYEGRFFDGQRWTHQVSDQGVLSVDPDWPPGGSGADTESSVAEVEPEPAYGVAEVAETSSGYAVGEIADNPEPEAASAAASVDAATIVHASPPPPLAPVVQESPARAVAVLDSVDERRPTEPLIADPRTPRSNKWLYLLAGLCLVAGAVLLGLTTCQGDDSADPVVEDEDVAVTEETVDAEPDDSGQTTDGEEVEAAVENAEDVVEEVVEDAQPVDRPVGPPGSVPVGALDIVNGRRLLNDLSEWHPVHIANRDIELSADASCSFGQLGQAAVQYVLCGPVVGSDESDFKYDLVPLEFEDLGNGQVNASALTGEVNNENNVPEGLELVGIDRAVPGGDDEMSEPAEEMSESEDDEMSETEDEGSDDAEPAEDNGRGTREPRGG